MIKIYIINSFVDFLSIDLFFIIYLHISRFLRGNPPLIKISSGGFSFIQNLKRFMRTYLRGLEISRVPFFSFPRPRGNTYRDAPASLRLFSDLSVGFSGILINKANRNLDRVAYL